MRCVYGQQNSRISEWEGMIVEFRRVVVCYMYWCSKCVWDCVEEVKKEVYRDMGSKIYVFSEYGEWDNEYKRVIVL